MILKELFDKPYKWQWTKKGPEGYYAVFYNKDGHEISFRAIYNTYQQNWEIIFKRNFRISKTGEGDAFAIFTTISEILIDFIRMVCPFELTIMADKPERTDGYLDDNRSKLYEKGLKIIARKVNYDLEILNTNDKTLFVMNRRKVNENFANSAGNLSTLSYQGDAHWRNEKDFFKKWFSLPYMTNGRSDQSVSEDAVLKVTDQMIKDKIQKVLKKYKISFKELNPILHKGQKIEFEHTDNEQVALNIALDHIEEFLDYYDRLEKVEEDTTNTSKKGAQGTLKAKISKRYGGGVTCDKAKNLKSRKNATAHDKSQANWFLNMNCKENQLDEIELTNASYQDNYTANIFKNLKKTTYKKNFQGYEINTGVFDDLLVVGIKDIAYILIYEKDNFYILGNSFVIPDYRGNNIKNLLITFSIKELKLTPLVSDNFLTKNSLKSWLKLSQMGFNLKVIDWNTKEISNLSDKNYLKKNNRFIIEEKNTLQRFSNKITPSVVERTRLIERLCRTFNIKLTNTIPLNESVYDHIVQKLKTKINVYENLNSNIGKEYLVYETTCKYLKNKDIKIYEYTDNTIENIVKNETSPVTRILGVAKNNLDNIVMYLKLTEDGRIVKGVNTTIDVDTDETKTQAKKFGNDVDIDGRPKYSFIDSVKLAGKIK